MNNNTDLINKYLQNELTKEERKAFEERLLSETELKEELQIQQQIIDAAIHQGIKLDFQKAMKQHSITRKIQQWSAIAAGITLMCFLGYLIAKNKSDVPAVSQNEINQLPAKKNLNAFIQPPSKNLNVPFSRYEFDAAKGDTLVYSSGSIIIFPPNGLVNASGELIQGLVTVLYREFADPLDFYLSGIPMSYDSAGKTYNFESAGMCEIDVLKDNKPVFVNQKNSPKIHLASKSNDPAHNLYYLDTNARNWKYVGKDLITSFKKDNFKKPVQSKLNQSENSLLPAKPVKPAKASGDRQAFSIAIEPGSFEELFAYDRLKFELLNEVAQLNTDAEELWKNVQLNRTNNEGVYTVTFSNDKRSVTYRVKPVLEGADYEGAIKIYNEKLKAYESALSKRLAADKQFNDSIATINRKEQKRIENEIAANNEMNALIIARNEKIKEKKKQFAIEAARNTALQEKAILLSEEAYRKRELQIQASFVKQIEENTLINNVMRTFTINQFGIWNCDNPKFPSGAIPLIPFFSFMQSKDILFNQVAVVMKNFNGVCQYGPTAQLLLLPGSPQMIWAIKENYFYYFSYTDFLQSGINVNTKQFSFSMKRSEQPLYSYQSAKEFIDKL